LEGRGAAARLRRLRDRVQGAVEPVLLAGVPLPDPGPVLDAIKKVTQDDEIFVYGVSDRQVGGLDLQKPDGNVAPVNPAALADNVPEPFKSEPAGGSGNRMHHKFVVIDFDKPTARVYLGSYNFSSAADKDNGENLLLICDRRVAVSYIVESLRIFDHYHFRVAQEEATEGAKKLVLATPREVRTKSPGGLRTTRLLRRFVIANSSLSQAQIAERLVKAKRVLGHHLAIACT
jgi:phosphatidylserine/phosphatidylglycerophosphate/cardiolipin synthase-like enzyme